MEKRKTVKELEAEIEKLKKELEEKTRSYKFYSDKDSDHNAEINALHMMINMFPGAPPKEVEGDRYGATNSVQSRLAGWLASRVFVAPPTK